MRERYGVSERQSGGRRPNRFADGFDYYEEPRASRRPAPTEDWRTPSVDPIGGRNLQGSRRGGGRGGRGGRPGGQINLPIIIGLLVVVILLVAVIVVAMNRCSEGSADVEGQGTQTEQTTDSTASGSDASGSNSSSASGSAASSGSTQDTNGIDRDKLTAIVDEEVADKLINRAKTSEDAKWIAQNPDKLAMDGIEVQAKLLKLAADEPAAQQYVRNFADKYPMKTPQNGQVKTVATGRSIPRFYQWDELWGYTTYSGTAFGLTGCCPTCLAMVYQGITGSHDLSPYDMGELAVRDGYATEYEGTYASFLVDEAETLGLPVSSLDISEKALKNALQSNQAVIVNFAPGFFTEYGHYVVISGMTQDGQLIMNDPYSEERSNQTWDISQIVEEAQGLYAYG
ncbi:MAG: C39 family peptidase [Coriobacteriia bacterium]|nr:C39 family peptidase [Coriobacteriia bacterium]